MFGTILRREVHQGFTSFTFKFILVMLTVLVVLGGYTQTRHYQKSLDDYTRRRTIHEAESNEQSVVLTKPVPPMLPFFGGVYERLPDEVTLRAGSFVGTPSSEDLKPLEWFFPDTDLGLIIGVLLTLMAIFMGHDVISGERERGTLKLILLNPITRRSVLLAKLTGVTFLMAIVLLYSVLLYVLTVLLVSESSYDLSGLRIIELAVLTLIGLMTVTVFTSLGVAISTLTKSSSTALAISIVFWLAMVIILPSLGPYIASSIRPVPPTQEARRLMLNKEAELDQSELDEHKNIAAELASQRRPVEFAWQRYLEVRRSWLERKEEELGRLVEERRKEIQLQQSIARWIIVISPYGTFRAVLNNLCGTGLENHDAFVASAERYGREEFVTAGFQFLEKEKPWVGSSDAKQRFQVPPFQPPTRSLAQRLKGMVPHLAVLIIETGLLILISLRKFERYEV